MTKKLTVACMFPHLTNSQGDAENARVAADLLSWTGYPAVVADVDPNEKPPSTAAAIILGHVVPSQLPAVREAWQQLRSWVAEQLSQGAVLFGVGGAARILVESGFLEGSIEERDEHVIRDIFGRSTQNLDVWGFENSTLTYQRGLSESPVANIDIGLSHDRSGTEGSIRQQKDGGLVVWTSLHGPFFARNPQLALELLTRGFASASLSQAAVDSARLERAVQLANSARTQRLSEVTG